MRQEQLSRVSYPPGLPRPPGWVRLVPGPSGSDLAGSGQQSLRPFYRKELYTRMLRRAHPTAIGSRGGRCSAALHAVARRYTRPKKLSENGRGLSQFCGILEAKWDCPPLSERRTSCVSVFGTRSARRSGAAWNDLRPHFRPRRVYRTRAEKDGNSDAAAIAGGQRSLRQKN
jgi:hypothetical protein